MIHQIISQRMGNCFCPTRTAVGARAVTIPSTRMSEPIFVLSVHHRTRATRSIRSCRRHNRWSNLPRLSPAMCVGSLMASKFQRGKTPDFFGSWRPASGLCARSVASEPLKKRSLSSKAAPGDIRPLLRLRARSADQPICHVRGSNLSADRLLPPRGY